MIPSMPLAKVSEYELPSDFTIEMARQRDGSILWAVRRGRSCLNKDLEMEYEPMPGSRDDEFLGRCRFSTAEDAYSMWERIKSQYSDES